MKPHVREKILFIATLVAAVSAFLAVPQLPQKMAYFGLLSGVAILIYLVTSPILEWRSETRYATSTLKSFEKELPGKLTLQPGNFRDNLARASLYVPLRYTQRSIKYSGRQERTHGKADAVEGLVDEAMNLRSTLILGDPGTGKTLAAMHLYATLADRRHNWRTRRKTPVPVFIKLGDLVDSGSTVGSDYRSLSLPRLQAEIGERRVHRLLDRGAIYFICDGLDEYSTSGPVDIEPGLPAPIAQIIRSPGSLTARQAFYDLYAGSPKIRDNIDTILEIQLLDEPSQLAFIALFGERLNRQDDASLVTTWILDNAALREVVQRPLLLRLATEVLYSRNMNVFHHPHSLTGSDHVTSDIYEEIINLWVDRDGRKVDCFLTIESKIDLLSFIAFHIFQSALKYGKAYGQFEQTDITMKYQQLQELCERWIAGRERPCQTSLVEVVAEVQDRTFLIVSHDGSTIRFLHKSFFEYLCARYVHIQLGKAGEQPSTDPIAALLPDEVIDFLRELLQMCWENDPEGSERRKSSLLTLLQMKDDATPLIAAQQAANLLPIVASLDVASELRGLAFSEVTHPFIRRAICVGLALHKGDSKPLGSFVDEMNRNVQARSFHMGYNRMYYGDQPLSISDFTDDGSPKCARFFTQCLKHVSTSRYREISAMAVASIRYMIEDDERLMYLREYVPDDLQRLPSLLTCDRPDIEAYDRECCHLIQVLDQVASGRSRD